MSNIQSAEKHEEGETKGYSRRQNRSGRKDWQLWLHLRRAFSALGDLPISNGIWAPHTSGAPLGKPLKFVHLASVSLPIKWE